MRCSRAALNQITTISRISIFCFFTSRYHGKYWKTKHKSNSFKLVLLVRKYLHLHIYIWMDFAGTREAINICSIGPPLGTQANPKHRLYGIGNGLGDDIIKERDNLYIDTLFVLMGRETTARVFDDLGKWARGPRGPPSPRAPGPPPRCPSWSTWGVPGCALTCAARAWAWAVPRAAPLGQALPTKSRGGGQLTSYLPWRL